jgi:hypothetical protein
MTFLLCFLFLFSLCTKNSSNAIVCAAGVSPDGLQRDLQRGSALVEWHRCDDEVRALNLYKSSSRICNKIILFGSARGSELENVNCVGFITEAIEWKLTVNEELGMSLCLRIAPADLEAGWSLTLRLSVTP